LQHGSVHSSIDVLFQAELGEPLNPVYFLSYLTKKYEKIYKI
jgi:Zn-dependent M32 family carboxypeptidase